MLLLLSLLLLLFLVLLFLCRDAQSPFLAATRAPSPLPPSLLPSFPCSFHFPFSRQRRVATGFPAFLLLLLLLLLLLALLFLHHKREGLGSGGGRGC